MTGLPAESQHPLLQHQCGHLGPSSPADPSAECSSVHTQQRNCHPSHRVVKMMTGSCCKPPRSEGALLPSSDSSLMQQVTYK